MALYRTYRPQSFADVIGQDHIVTTLERAVNQGKLAHAYLFAGSRGTGKTSAARILAKEIMTHGIEDATLRAQIAKGVEEGSIVDLLEIDAASNRGIDDVRDLIEKIQFSPVVAAAKVYIIDEVHMLSKDAFNALLKTLEEPPPYAYFILATTEVNKIPATILSRCQCFPFRHISDDDIIRRLQYIADQEHIVIDREALRAIAHHAEGGMRDAISLLDQMRSLPKISLKDVEERTGLSGQEFIEEISAGLEQRNPQALIDAVRHTEEAGIPLDLLLRQLLSLTRSRLHRGIEQKEDVSAILDTLDILLEAIRDVRIAPVPGLVLEAALIKLTMDREKHLSHPQGMFGGKQEGSRKEKETAKAIEIGKPPEEETTPKRVEAEAVEEKPLSTIEAPELTLASLKAHWPKIVDGVTPASVKMSLKNGVIDDLAEGKVLLHFTATFHRDKVASVDASRTIEQIMQTIFKRSLKLECSLAKVSHAPAEIRGVEVNLADAAKEIF